MICFIYDNTNDTDYIMEFYWFEVTINNAIPKSILELKEWLI
jgi:hypothetical protein